MRPGTAVGFPQWMLALIFVAVTSWCQLFSDLVGVSFQAAALSQIIGAVNSSFLLEDSAPANSDVLVSVSSRSDGVSDLN